MINEFGYDVADGIEDFFQKLIDWKNEQKPSSLTVNTAKKFVGMNQEKPKMLAVFEKMIIIDYDHSVIEVESNLGEFLFLGKKNNEISN